MSSLLKKLERDRARAKLHKTRAPRKKKAANGNGAQAAPAKAKPEPSALRKKYEGAGQAIRGSYESGKERAGQAIRGRYERGKTEATRRFRRVGGAPPDAKQLTRVSKKVAKESWIEDHHPRSLLVVARYLEQHGSETPDNVRRLKAIQSELRALGKGGREYWLSAAGDRQMADLSDELRALTDQRQPQSVYNALWVYPFSSHAPEQVRMKEIREDDWFRLDRAERARLAGLKRG